MEGSGYPPGKMGLVNVCACVCMIRPNIPKNPIACLLNIKTALGVIVKLIQIDNFSEKGLARPRDQKVSGLNPDGVTDSQ